LESSLPHTRRASSRRRPSRKRVAESTLKNRGPDFERRFGGRCRTTSRSESWGGGCDMRHFWIPVLLLLAIVMESASLYIMWNC
jgi:hypothetical protein